MYRTHLVPTAKITILFESNRILYNQTSRLCFLFCEIVIFLTSLLLCTEYHNLTGCSFCVILSFFSNPALLSFNSVASL